MQASVLIESASVIMRGRPQPLSLHRPLNHSLFLGNAWTFQTCMQSASHKRWDTATDMHITCNVHLSVESRPKSVRMECNLHTQSSPALQQHYTPTAY